MPRSFKDQLKQLFSPEGYSDQLKLPPGCGGPSQIILTGMEMISFEGCNSLLDYAKDHITLSLCDRIVTVYGQNLTMKTFNADQVAVCGRIDGIFKGNYREELASANC